ncbi:MAG: L,D-transpeptidase family protein [Pseudomonadales bacterium]|nr:L,D-transpeptidase family protein [Pseudomonadales bacterium]MCP5337541.1 L,D-transpeptidase family protein [Pseudomonadales bacterium]
MAHETGNGQQPSSRAYDVLRRLGLLPSDAPAPKAVVRTTDVRVVVEKSKRRLYVLRNGKPFLEYPVMLGGVPVGPKLQAGDLRTPEGVYTLDWRNPKSRFHKSMHISYPGPLDRQRAEERGVDPGGMIMLHGEHDEPALRRILRRSARDWTEGCIALNNEDMDEIWRTVPDGTPIEIRP